MLSLALVLIVGLGSVGLYLTAYVYPEIHRKTDIWWSGTGLFYALILLIYRRPFGLLLGHAASVVLLVWLSYQALQRRWAMVEASPPQPEEGTWGAQARKISDQIIVKIASVDWQGLWQRMGAKANDGTSEKSILPPAIRQRLDLSGLGEKLKGMISGKDVAETDGLTESIQPTEDSTPTVNPHPAMTIETTVETTVQSAPVNEPTTPVEDKIAEAPQDKEPKVEAAATEVKPLTPSSAAPKESSAKPDSNPETTIQVEPAVEDKTTEQPETKKDELKAELDQVISDLTPEEGQDASSTLPQPPDPLG
ncbi:Ycf66 family protein [Acaryochloris sp. IP29b_bin.137]|uniref:Ycf66 family protein n=1 Tax=Acaryochloris sp. IP29b_bin.137 TaxID=2969217 RepID=UPI002619C77D|nr:Ycf66 family protein [Acaryochloris sp. IP29b_bin.137]